MQMVRDKILENIVPGRMLRRWSRKRRKGQTRIRHRSLVGKADGTQMRKTLG